MINKLKFVKLKDIFSGFKLLIVLLPALIAKIFIRDFWLVCEREDEARDNGYWFFKYVTENQKQQKVAYAINKKCVDYSKVKNLGKIIKYGGISHWFWYIVADKNISSQKGGKPNAAVCYFLEVVLKLRKNNRVFLQHGITKDLAEWLFYKNTYMKRFCVSINEEYNYLCENFGYPDGNICLTGLCRFDNLNNSKTNSNQILVMPTWRQWIAREVEMKEIEGTTNFLESNYYKSWSSFLKNENLHKLLKQHNKTLIFYPHSNMQKYLTNFKNILPPDKNIIIASGKDYDVQQLLKDSALLITDYSSIYFDFAYMKKPIIFYQFDEAKFRENQYSQGYFNYHNTPLGTWAGKEEEVITEINKVIDNNMKAINEEELENYFTFRDDKNCERTYQMIKNIK